MNIKDLTRFLFSYTSLFLMLIVFVLLILYTLTTISKVIFLIVDIVKISFFTETLNTSVNSIDLFIKLISIFIAFYLLFIIYSIITAVSTYNAYKIAAQKYSVEKHNPEDILFKVINWNFYRIIYILSPVLSIGAIIGILVFLNAFLFNIVLSLAGFSIGLVTFLTSFILISIVVGVIFSAGMSIYNIFTTLFGIECAVSEPDLENNVIRKRSKKLSLINKSNIKIHIFYLIFLLTLIVQFATVLLFPDKLIGINLVVLATLAVIDIAFYIGLGYLKASLYVDSIVYQYNRITFKDKNSLADIICEF